MCVYAVRADGYTSCREPEKEKWKREFLAVGEAGRGNCDGNDNADARRKKKGEKCRKEKLFVEKTENCCASLLAQKCGSRYWFGPACWSLEPDCFYIKNGCKQAFWKCNTSSRIELYRKITRAFVCKNDKILSKPTIINKRNTTFLNFAKLGRNYPERTSPPYSRMATFLALCKPLPRRHITQPCIIPTKPRARPGTRARARG